MRRNILAIFLLFFGIFGAGNNAIAETVLCAPKPSGAVGFINNDYNDGTVGTSTSYSYTGTSGQSAQITGYSISQCASTVGGAKGQHVGVLTYSENSNENVYCWAMLVRPFVTNWVFLAKYSSLDTCISGCTRTQSTGVSASDVVSARKIYQMKGINEQ